MALPDKSAYGVARFNKYVFCEFLGMQIRFLIMFHCIFRRFVDLEHLEL